MGTPSIKSTRQNRTQVDTTQRRNKKQTINTKKKTGKDPKKGLPSLLRVGSWSVAGKTVAITYCPCYLPTTIRRRDFGMASL